MDTDNLVIKKKNEVSMQITCGKSIAYELRDHFSFMTPNAQFDPRVRNRAWDGKKRLFNITHKTLPIGLLLDLIQFCDERSYTYAIDPKLFPEEIPKIDFDKFWDLLKLPENFEKRDYQIRAFNHCIDNQRSTLIMPTGSGKSLLIYLLTQFFKKSKNIKTLIIVDSVSLVYQMKDDFLEYNANLDDLSVHVVHEGQSPYSDADVVISTWQSIYQLDKTYFDQYKMIIGDEAHKFNAKCLNEIMKKATKTKYRFGTTGTIDESASHEMVLTGYFGPIHRVISTRELIDQGTLANLKINCIDLKYNAAAIKHVKNKKKSYSDEVDWIVTRPERNQFILNLCNALSGNKLVLFQYVEKHGKQLYNLFEQQAKNPVFYITGEVKGEQRNQIRKTVNQAKGSSLLASYGTTQTGINIVNINHIILASPSKSKIRVLQSIGRGLRKGEIKHDIVVWDIVDNLGEDNYYNHVLKHFFARLDIYNKEQFEYSVKHTKIFVEA